MDKNDHFLESLPTHSLKLTFINDPFFQKQHRNYWSIPLRTIDEYDLFVCLSGKALFKQNNNEFLLEEGYALLILPNIPFSAEHIGDGYFVAIAQHFNIKIFDEIDLFKMIDFNQKQKLSDWDFIKKIIERYIKLNSKQIKKLEQHSLFNTLLYEYIYDSYIKQGSNSYEKYTFIFDMLSYIQKNFTKDDVLKKSYFISPYSSDYTTRVFKKKIGLPPKQYILKTKLNHSRTLLSQNRQIKEVAYICGFSDELYFSRIFKKNFNISPSEFKKQQI